MRLGFPQNRRRAIQLGLSLFGILLLAILGNQFGSDASRRAVERTHGVKLPLSARHVQSKGLGLFFFLKEPDRGVVSMFEINSSDMGTFTQQLIVKSKGLP